MSTQLYPSTTVKSAADVGLFTPAQVAGATFFGTPLAGAALMAMNHARQGRMGEALATIAAGLFAMVVIAVAAIYLLPAVPASLGTIIGLGYMLVMRQIAQGVQGAEVEAHVAAGGAKGSIGEAIGVTLLSLGSALLVLFLVALAAG